MKAHPESTKVQRQACRAVSNICIKNVDLKQEVGKFFCFFLRGTHRIVVGSRILVMQYNWTCSSVEQWDNS